MARKRGNCSSFGAFFFSSCIVFNSRCCNGMRLSSLIFHRDSKSWRIAVSLVSTQLLKSYLPRFSWFVRMIMVCADFNHLKGVGGRVFGYDYDFLFFFYLSRNIHLKNFTISSKLRVCKWRQQSYGYLNNIELILTMVPNVISFRNAHALVHGITKMRIFKFKLFTRYSAALWGVKYGILHISLSINDFCIGI